MVFAHDFMNSLGIIDPDSVKESIKLRIVKNAIKALKKLHSFGIAHTDIKPDNLIIDINTGSVKFIDFGLSCLKYCTVSSCAGTIDYMSPERLKCDPKKLLDLEVGKRGDLYALGLTLYDFVYNNGGGKIVFKDNYKKFNKIIEPLLKI
jgi:serine/threonine protein kinase